jgi:hypothetical protein
MRYHFYVKLMQPLANTQRVTNREATMRQLAMTVTALTMFVAMMAAAQADDLHGAPDRRGNQCFTFSPMGNARESRFGSWGDCPKTASTNVATTPRITRRHRASR